MFSAGNLILSTLTYKHLFDIRFLVRGLWRMVLTLLRLHDARGELEALPLD